MFLKDNDGLVGGERGREREREREREKSRSKRKADSWGAEDRSDVKRSLEGVGVS